MQHSFLYTVCTPKSVCYFTDLVAMLEMSCYCKIYSFLYFRTKQFCHILQANYRIISQLLQLFCCLLLSILSLFILSLSKGTFFFILHILKHSDLITGVSGKVLDLTSARSNSVVRHSKILMQIQSLPSLL